MTTTQKFPAKILATLLAMIMIITYLPMTAFAAPAQLSADGWPSVTNSSASLYGYINANNGLNIRQSGFQYKLTTSSTWITC